MGWPTKSEREAYEIANFVRAYQGLPEHVELEVIGRSECPDYFVRNTADASQYGVELTSVYLSDASVPDKHIPPLLDVREIPYDKAKLVMYQGRIVDAIRRKIEKAKVRYARDFPLILSIYLNEYISIHIDDEDMTTVISESFAGLNRFSPFSEVILWGVSREVLRFR